MVALKVASLFVVVLCCSAVASRKLPSYITRCHRNDPQLTQCLRNAVEVLKPRLREGVPELNLPSLHPLVIPSAGIESGNTFNATFKNIKVYYAYDFDLENIDVDLENVKLDLAVKFPKLRITSQYNINGRILFLQLRGQGPGDGNFTDVRATASGTGKKITKNGKVHLNIDHLDIKGKYGKPVFEFSELFANNPDVTAQTNKIINENVEEIIQELEPVINKIVGDIVFTYVNRIFSRFSFDELFPL